MDGQERQKFPWGKWDWLGGGPCTPGPPKAEKREMLLQGALHLQSLRLSLGGLAYGRDCGGGLSPLILLPIFCTSVPRGLTVCQRMGLA